MIPPPLPPSHRPRSGQPAQNMQKHVRFYKNQRFVWAQSLLTIQFGRHFCIFLVKRVLFEQACGFKAKCLGKSWSLGLTLGLPSKVSGQKLASGVHFGASKPSVWATLANIA